MAAADNIEIFRNSSLIVAAISFAAFLLIHIVGRWKERRVQCDLNHNYPLIYRIKTVPSDNQLVLKADGASVEVGDYGWQAEPIFNDGKIYLHGLNDRWQVVWYISVAPEQVEPIGPKPRTQYNAFPYWINEKKVSTCPYPVQIYRHGIYLAEHYGFPVKIRGDWVQGKKIIRARGNQVYAD